MENEKSVDDWELNSLAWELYWWVSFFKAAFFKGEPVPIPASSSHSFFLNFIRSCYRTYRRMYYQAEVPHHKKGRSYSAATGPPYPRWQQGRSPVVRSG